MGQAANKSRRKENEARAYSKYIRSSWQKLNVVAATIRGKNAGRALIDLQFSPRRVSKEVHKTLQSAIANAENNHGLNVDRLVVAEAVVGRTLVMTRFHARARGRVGAVEKKFSNLLIVLREPNEKVDGEKSAKPKKAKAAPKQKANNKPAAKKRAAAG
jgi:large subunit ribosomal protein L22